MTRPEANRPGANRRPTVTRRPRIGDWADADGLRRVQDEQLGRTLEAAARSPFYRRRGVPVDRAGLENHPLTTKQDLRNAYPFGLLAVDREQVATYHESSGSTGTPTALRAWRPASPNSACISSDAPLATSG